MFSDGACLRSHPMRWPIDFRVLHQISKERIYLLKANIVEFAQSITAMGRSRYG
jgi:hypothetical protein